MQVCLCVYVLWQEGAMSSRINICFMLKNGGRFFVTLPVSLSIRKGMDLRGFEGGGMTTLIVCPQFR